MAKKKTKKAAPKKAAPKKAAKKSAPKKTAKAKASPAKKPAKAKAKPEKLVAEHVLSVRTREEAQALRDADRPQLAAAVKGILGYDRGELAFDRAIDMLDGERMGLYKLRLATLEKAAVWDVWINTVMDDGIVLATGKAESSGIGISQTRVYDMIEHREDVCDAIHEAIYRKGVALLPEFIEWS